jgi:hypothetical protein
MLSLSCACDMPAQAACMPIRDAFQSYMHILRLARLLCECNPWEAESNMFQALDCTLNQTHLFFSRRAATLSVSWRSFSSELLAS